MRVKVLQSFMHNSILVLPDKEIEVTEALGLELISLGAAEKVQGGHSVHAAGGNDLEIPEDMKEHVVESSSKMIAPVKRNLKKE